MITRCAGGALSVARLLALALVFLPCALAAAEGRQEREPRNAFEKSRPARDDLASPLMETGEVRVIVGLRGASAVAKRRGESDDAEDRRAIAGRQDRLLQRLQRHPVRTVKRFRSHDFVAMTVDSAALDQLLADPDVVSVSEDRRLYTQLYDTPTITRANLAWAAGYRGAGQVVAVIDTGVDKTHPLLANKVVAEACFSHPGGGETSLCPGGVTSSTAPGSAAPCSYSGCHHGTHVAGIVAGHDGILGTNAAGMAPDADLIAIQAFVRSCSGSTCSNIAYSSDIALALEHVYSLRNTYNIAAVNMSLGGGIHTAACDGVAPAVSAIISSLRAADIATLVASGNNGSTTGISFPACISSAISVGSVSKQGAVSSFSNSSNLVGLLAPGGNITSSVPGGGYAVLNGTSMATPHVAGAWAVLKAAQPAATVSQIQVALQSGGTPVTDSRNGVVKPAIRIGYNATAPGALGYLLGTGNLPLTVTLTSPPDGMSLPAPASFSLTAVAAGQNVTLVEFFAAGTKIGEVAAPGPYTMTWSNVAAGTYAVSARVTDGTGATLTTPVATVSVTDFVPDLNVAAQANGGVATASSVFLANLYPPGAVNNGDRNGLGFGNGGGWLDGTPSAFPDWVQVAFNGVKTIGEIDVFTIQDAFATPVAPTPGQTFTFYGITAFQVQYYDGTAWQDVPGGNVTGNSLVWRKFTFPPISTQYIRVLVTGSTDGYSRIAEIEAWTGSSGPSNAAPTVSLTSPTTGATLTTPATVSLGATAADSDGSISKVEFYRGATLVATVNGAGPYNASDTGLVAGSYSYTARAYDNAGGVTTSAAVVVTVSNPNVAPTVNLTAPAGGASYTAPATIVLTASASDGDGSVSRVEFYSGSTLIGTVNAAPYTFSWSNVGTGSYTLSARVYDNLNAVGTSTAVVVTVNAPNAAPTVNLTSPTVGATFTAPATVSLGATAADSDGSISKVEFYRGATLVATVNGAGPYTASDTGVAGGSYSYTARAYDNAGGITTSAAVAVTVNNPNVAPTVNLTSPTVGATFTAPATVSLGATAADSDGSISKVEFYRGATLVATVNGAGPYSASDTGLAAGSYSYTARAYDNAGGITTSAAVAVAVQIPSVNVAAQANGGVAVASSILGTGFAASAVNNGDRKGQGWGSGGGWLDANRNNFPDWVQITFNGVKTISEINVFTIQDAFAAPVEPTETQTFSLYGITSYQVQYWTGSAWAAVPGGTITGNNLVWRKITFAPVSTQFIRVVVTGSTDGYSRIAEIEAWTGASAPSNLPPTISLTSPTGGASFTTPATVSLGATAADSDGSISKVEFYRGATLVATVNGAGPYNASDTGLVAGSYSYTARAYDNAGGVTTSAAVVVTVSNPNVAPTVNLTAPAGGASYTAPATIVLTASASDGDGSVSRVEFYSGSTLIGTVNAAPYTFSWSNVGTGSYTLSARAYDNLNAVGTSTAVVVTVNAPNAAPTVNLTSPTVGATFTAPATVSLSATAADSDGSISKVEFYRGATLVATVNGAGPYTASDTGVAGGSYSYTARAYDNAGGITTSAPAAVTVNAPSGGNAVNVAAQANGGVAVASSALGPGFNASAVNNGDRKGQGWGSGGGWLDANRNSFPDWVQITFNGVKTISEINVFTIQDAFAAPVEPTETQTFSLYGITSYQVQYWTGSAWVAVPGGTITGNNLVWRKITFAPVSTQFIRVVVTGSTDGYSRIAEIEAWTAP